MRNIRNERQLATLVLLAVVVYISASGCCFSTHRRYSNSGNFNNWSDISTLNLHKKVVSIWICMYIISR